MNDSAMELLLSLKRRDIDLYYLAAAMIETMTGTGDTCLSGLSKGQYKRIIRKARMAQSSHDDPGYKAAIDDAIGYIRENMEAWRA